MRSKRARKYIPPYYPYRYDPPELDGTRYLDLCAEFSGQDEEFADIPAANKPEGKSDHTEYTRGMQFR